MAYTSRKPQNRGIDEIELVSGTEESEDYETGLAGDSEIENEENADVSSQPAPATESEGEPNVTMVLRSRSKRAATTKRKSYSPKRPKTSRKQKVIETAATVETQIGQGDQAGYIGIMKTAVQEMTSQIIAAITTAFRGIKGDQQVHNQRKENRNNQQRTRSKVRRTSSSLSAHNCNSDTPSEDSTDEEEPDAISISTSQIVEPRRSKKDSNVIAKLPAYTGKEKWEVYINRFEAVASLLDWEDRRKLQELLPRLQGPAGEFVFDQLSDRTLKSYSKLKEELKNRFGVIERKKTYRVHFNRRNQMTGETTENYAAELKRIYDKAYTNRDAHTRQEDLLQRFLMGLADNKARVHIELTKDPKTIEEAVQEVITYFETTKDPKHDDYENRHTKRPVRQIKKNSTEKPKFTEPTGKLNGRKPPEIAPQRQRTDKHKDTALDACTLNKEEFKTMFNMWYEEKKTAEKERTQSYNGGRNFNQPFNRKDRDPNGEWSKGNLKDPYNQPMFSSSRNLVCYYCGQPGHFARSCYSNPNRQPDKKNDGNQYRSPNEQASSRPWTGYREQFENKTEKSEDNQQGSLGPSPGYSLN